MVNNFDSIRPYNKNTSIQKKTQKMIQKSIQRRYKIKLHELKKQTKKINKLNTTLIKSFCFHLSGTVKVWDPRQKDKPVANMAPAEGEEGRDCWCVAFGKLAFLLNL